MFFFRFFSLVSYYKILNIVPVLCSRSLLEVFSFLKERNNGQACVTGEAQTVMQKNLMELTYLSIYLFKSFIMYLFIYFIFGPFRSLLLHAGFL